MTDKLIWEAHRHGSTTLYGSHTYGLSINGHEIGRLTMSEEEWLDFAARMGLAQGQDGVWRSDSDTEGQTDG